MVVWYLSGGGGQGCVATGRAIQGRRWGVRRSGLGAAVVLAWYVWLKIETVGSFLEVADLPYVPSAII